MPGRSRVYVGQSVPVVAAHAANGPSVGACSGGCGGWSWKLYSTGPERCSSSVRETLKSKLKSLSFDEAHGKLQPMRCLYASSLSSGARDTAKSITSWFARWIANPLKPSAIAEHEGQPAVLSGPNMKWQTSNCERPRKSA